MALLPVADVFFDRCCPGVAALPETSGRIVRCVGPRSFFVPAISRMRDSLRNVPACLSDSLCRLCLPGCFSRRAGIGSSDPPEYRPNFRYSYRAGNLWRNSRTSTIRCISRSVACPGIGEEGAAELTVHGDKRLQIRPGRKVPSFRTNALHALDIAEVVRSNRFP